MLKIVKIPNQVLTTPTKEVTKVDAKIISLVHDMEETLVAQVDPQGVGLAAPQVGISLSLFIVKPRPNVDTEVFINPKILASDPLRQGSEMQENDEEEEDLKLEGCLSIPRIWSPVSRAPRVHLHFMDLDGIVQSKWFKGFKAIIVQHEVDHLKGVLFTQRAVEQGSQLYEEKNGDLKKVNF